MTTTLHHHSALGPDLAGEDQERTGDHSTGYVPALWQGATLFVEPLEDPVVDELGHDPRSSYVELYWLPVLGPSTTWLLRRFAACFDEHPQGFDVEVEELARFLGIGERFGANAPFSRTIKRCVDFQMAEWRPKSLAVRRWLPPLAGRHLRRLPQSLRDRHTAEVEAVARQTFGERLRIHGRRLALSLLDFGEDRAACEQQLVRWAFHPALASECAAWAALEQARRKA
ncbi:MAG TPA: hypothetical protein VGP46_13690, partial [Acidimicrobiales bacterium]|nr:hypothetical protein [Acidimicrobiales bacterium]